jgi:formylglycine-generating enzyme required for sulfatase activity
MFPVMKTSLTGRLAVMSLLMAVSAAASAETLHITGVERAGNSLRLDVQSEIGLTNSIEFRTNLVIGDWVVLTNVVASQPNYSLFDFNYTGSAARFYRVAVAAPVGMVFIPSGAFTMGNCMAANEGNAAELPLHQVYVSGFYGDRYLVTSNLWRSVWQWATNHGYAFDNPGAAKGTNHPVQGLSWYDAVKWCNARSEMEGLTPAYYTNAAQGGVYRAGQLDLPSAAVKWTAGYRLPTEAEWEKAGRGGMPGHRFPWTYVDTISWTNANYTANPGLYPYDVNAAYGNNPLFAQGFAPYTSPVASFPANGFGLYDMSGNVLEWCWDWFDENWYSNAGATQNDTRGPSSSPVGYRTVRGGAWDMDAKNARVANRNPFIYSPPSITSYDLGFRCVRGL